MYSLLIDTYIKVFQMCGMVFIIGECKQIHVWLYIWGSSPGEGGEGASVQCSWNGKLDRSCFHSWIHTFIPLGLCHHFWGFCLYPSSVVLLYLLSQTHLVAPPKVPAVKKKAEWALKWINATNSSYAERIVAFASVEVIVAFSSLLSSNQLFEIREYFSPAPLPRSSGWRNVDWCLDSPSATSSSQGSGPLLPGGWSTHSQC